MTGRVMGTITGIEIGREVGREIGSVGIDVGSEGSAVVNPPIKPVSTPGRLLRFETRPGIYHPSISRIPKVG